MMTTAARMAKSMYVRMALSRSRSAASLPWPDWTISFWLCMEFPLCFCAGWPSVRIEDKKMAYPAGVEPTTPGFGGHCLAVRCSTGDKIQGVYKIGNGKIVQFLIFRKKVFRTATARAFHIGECGQYRYALYLSKPILCKTFTMRASWNRL